MATVGEVLREVLPSGTVCLAGQVALSRPTISAVVLRLRGGLADLAPGGPAQFRPAAAAAGTAVFVACRLAQRWSCVPLQLHDTRRGRFRSWRRR